MVGLYTYNAISPLLAIRIESKERAVCDVPDTDDAALVVLRAAVGARRGVMRRRDERVMTGGESSDLEIFCC